MSSLPYILLAGMLANIALAEYDAALGVNVPIRTAADPDRTYSGDQITLKSGRVLHGVRIIRKTPLRLYLEVIPSVDPLIIPAKQVSAISYGHVTRSTPEAKQDVPAENPVSNVLPAVKIAPEFVKQLSAPISESPLRFENQDIVNTLRSAGIMSGISVTFGPGLKKLPLDRRKSSIEIAEGTSFEDFLQQIFIPAFPWIAVEYRFDTVHFEVKAE